MKAQLKVKGMHCPSCEMLIKDSLEQIDGIVKADVSHKKHRVIVTYDVNKVSIDQIKRIKDKGYDAK